MYIIVYLSGHPSNHPSILLIHPSISLSEVIIMLMIDVENDNRDDDIADKFC